MSEMKRTGKRSMFDNNPQLYTNIMHQASLGLTGIQIAEKLRITNEAAQNTIRVTRAISRKDWDEIVEKSDAKLETIKDIQKKVDAIDANWYTTKDMLGAIKDNTGKWRNRT